MGNYLSSPVATKRSHNGSVGNINYGVSSMQGWRVTMEDAHLICTDVHHPTVEPLHLFGVFDGHGGPHVARYAAKHLLSELQSSPGYNEGLFKSAFQSAYCAIDTHLSDESTQSELLTLRELSAASFDHYMLNGYQHTFKTRASLLRSDSSFTAPSSATHLDSSRSAGGVKGCRSASNSIASDMCSDGAERNNSLIRLSSHTDGGRSNSQSSCLSTHSTHSTHSTLSTTSEGVKKKSGLSMKSIRDGIVGLFNGSRLGGMLKSQHSYRGAAGLAGSTAITLLYTGKEVYVANAGDSRCVLCRGTEAVPLSFDHKPTLREERARIYEAGGYLTAGRVNGNLNLSRALGDLLYKSDATRPPSKQLVIALPDVKQADVQEEDEFIVIGCDGIWELMSCQDVVNFVLQRIDAASALSTVIEELFDSLLSPNPEQFECGCDNMTAIIIDLKPHTRSINKVNAEAQHGGVGLDLDTAAMQTETTCDGEGSQSLNSADMNDSTTAEK